MAKFLVGALLIAIGYMSPSVWGWNDKACLGIMIVGALIVGSSLLPKGKKGS